MGERNILGFLEKLPFRRQQAPAVNTETNQNGYQPAVHIPMERLKKTVPGSRQITILYRNSLNEGINYHQDSNFEPNIVPGVD